MSLMEQVREIGAEEARVEDAQLGRARQALLREAARSAHPTAARASRRWAGIGAAGLAAGAATTALVLGSVLAPAAVVSAAAAEVLEEAAEMTITAIDTELAPGQFLRIEERYDFLQFWDDAWPDGDESTQAYVVPGRMGAAAAALVRDTRVLYVPSDRSADWFMEWGPLTILDTFGDRGAEAAADVTAFYAGRNGGVERWEGGEIPAEGADKLPTPYLIDRLRPHYDEMPREPQALLDWLRAPSGETGPAADGWLMASLSSPHVINLMPADLRASTFRALALIPGLEVTARDGDLVTLEHTVPGGRASIVVLDTAAGLIRSFAERWGEGGVAADTPDSLITVHLRVVDEAPGS